MAMVLHFLDFTLDLTRVELRRAGALLDVSEPARRVLGRLARTPFVIVTRDDLVSEWGSRVSDGTLSAAVAELRKVLATSPYVGEGPARIAAKRILVAHYGGGYEFRPPPRIIDFRLEWNRHGDFYGREVALTRIDEWLGGDAFDSGYVVLTGSPGVGKSAILTHWLHSRGREAPHHFIRKGVQGWNRPHEILRNLLAQIDPAASADGDVAALKQRLVDALMHASPRRPVVVLDGLDEIATADDADNPLPEILPESLPKGVHVLCASRPTSHLSWLDARSHVRRIDLDSAGWVTDNASTCRVYWQTLRNTSRSGVLAGLSDTFVEAAVGAADGSMLYTVKLMEAIVEAQTPGDVRVLPVGLAGFLHEEWRKLERLPAPEAACVQAGLRVLCVAREPLSLSELEWVIDGTEEVGSFSRVAFLRHGRPFLHEMGSGEVRYRLFHESFRELVACGMPRRILQGWHRRIAETLAVWPAASAQARFAGAHAIFHRGHADQPAALERLCFDIDHLVAKLAIDGVEGLEADLEQAARRCSEQVVSGKVGELSQAIRQQAHWIRRDPGAIGTLLQFALRGASWSDSDAGFGLRALDLRLRHPLQHSDEPLRVLPSPGIISWDSRIAADGATAVSASFEEVVVWDLASGRQRMLLRGHTRMVLGCAPSHDSRMIASGGFDCTVRIWDVNTGRCLHVLREEAVVGRLVFTSDGMVVAPCWDGSLGIWDAARGELVRRIAAHGRAALRCATTPDGGRILSASRDHTLALWDLASGRELLRLTGHAGSVTGCDVTGDGRHAVSGGSDDEVRLWDLTDGRCVGVWPAGQQGINHCIFTGDGHEVITAGNDGSVQRWDVRTGKVECVANYPLGAFVLAVDPRARHLLTGGYNGLLKVWDLQRAAGAAAGARHTTSVTHCVLSPDRMRAYTGADDRTIRVWDVASGRSIGVLRGHTGPITACALDPGSHLLASGSEDGTVRVWDLKTGATRVLRGHTGWVTACGFIRSGAVLLSGSTDGTVRRWDLAGDRVDVLSTGRGVSCGAAGGGRVVFGREDGRLDVWDADADTARPFELAGHHGGVVRTAVAPGGRLVALIEGPTVKVWDLETGSCIASLRGSREEVMDCCFLGADGPVVAVSADCTVRLWNLAARHCDQVWYGNAPCLAVDASGTDIVVGDFAGNVLFLRTGEPCI